MAELIAFALQGLGGVFGISTVIGPLVDRLAHEFVHQIARAQAPSRAGV
jgi:hypothetical protein